MAFAAVALSLAAPCALSQSYPSKPVRLIVGFAPGGVSDVPARIVAAKLGEVWGTPVVVENRTGAGGIIATDVAARAPADGYTLLLVTAGLLAINPSIYKKLPYDPVKDFAAISMIGSTPNVLLVHPSAQTTTVSAFITYAKANPGKVSIGSAGVGTSRHLTMELFKSITATDIVHVPYKGGASALTDLLGGQVPAIVSGVTTALTSIKAGKVRALGVTSAKRSPQLPELPTIAESGVPGFEVTAWTGLCAPAALPKPLVAKLNADMVKVLGMPDTQRRLAEQGVDDARTVCRIHQVRDRQVGESGEGRRHNAGVIGRRFHSLRSPLVDQTQSCFPGLVNGRTSFRSHGRAASAALSLAIALARRSSRR